MLRFSLWHVFPAITFFGCGLAVARGPHGDWLDVPFSVLTFCFVFSLLRQSRALRGVVATISSRSRDTDRGCRVLNAVLIALAIMLSVSWALRLFAAVDPQFPKSHDFLTYLLKLPVLPRALGLLTMLAAVTVDSWRSKVDREHTLIYHFSAGLGVLATAAVIIAYEANQTLVPVIVHIAICGIESAQSPRFATQGLEPNVMTRTLRFAMAGFAGCALTLLNLLFVVLLVGSRHARRRYAIALALLVSGVSVQCGIAMWIVRRGVWQLSPAWSEALHTPPFVIVATVAGLILVAGGINSWRNFAKAVPIESPSTPVAIAFHETWSTSLILGTLAMTIFVEGNPIIFEYIRGNATRSEFAESLISPPNNFLLVAVAIAGFFQAGKRFIIRRQPLPNALPCVDVYRFVIVMLATILMMLASGPIALAAGFGIWFIDAWPL